MCIRDSFLTINAAGTIVTVLLKGIASGAGAGLVYTLLKKFNRYLATFVAALAAPVCNTGVFLIGCSLFFWDTISEWGAAAGFESAAAYVILSMVGVNFLVETGINAVLSPIIVRLVDVIEKQFKKA